MLLTTIVSQLFDLTINLEIMTRKAISVNIKSTTADEIYDRSHHFNDKAFLRFFYKPCEGGTVWGYHRNTLSFRSFSEIPDTKKMTVKPNKMLIHT
jgi:hypothetical protein